MGSLADRLELVEITSVEQLPDARRRKPHWVVTVGLRREHPAALKFEVTWYLEKARWPDHALLTITRNWMHHICSEIAEETRDWALEKEQIEAMQIPQPNRPSRDIA